MQVGEGEVDLLKVKRKVVDPNYIFSFIFTKY